MLFFSIIVFQVIYRKFTRTSEKMYNFLTITRGFSSKEKYKRHLIKHEYTITRFLYLLLNVLEITLKFHLLPAVKN